MSVLVPERLDGATVQGIELSFLFRRSYGPKFRHQPGDQQANEAAKDYFCDLMQAILDAAQLRMMRQSSGNDDSRGNWYIDDRDIAIKAHL
jgi:hypothetical protein